MVLSCLGNVTVWTDQETEKTWIYYVPDNNAAIDYNTWATGDIIIPSTINSKTVTKINSFAFQACNNLNSLTIPSSVTTIGCGIIGGCTNLQKLIVMATTPPAISDATFIDYDIPLYLSRSVSRTIGKDRLEKVVLSAVDEKMNFIPGTEMEIECDTLVLSVGLIPYISLLNNIDCPTSNTKGAVVNNYMETMIDGIFSCGNCLHVHDVVDFVTDEGRAAGHGAALYLQNKIHQDNSIKTIAGNGVNYVVPQLISKNADENVTLKLRVRAPMKDQWVVIKSKGNVIQKVFKSAVIPSEMLLINLSKDKKLLIFDELTVELEGK